MLKQYFHLVCLLAVWALANGEPILLSNAQSFISEKVTRDTSFSVTVTAGATNMNNTMRDDAADELTDACRVSNTVAGIETIFQTNFGAIYTNYNWNIFEHCGTYVVYADLYVILTAVVIDNNVTTTYQFLIFSSDK